MLYLRTISDQKTESQCKSRNILLDEAHSEDQLHGEEVALMPVKDGSASRALLVDRGCCNFISKRTGRVLKATEDQEISVQV